MFGSTAGSDDVAVQITVEVEGCEPLSGRVCQGSSAPVRFVGWLGLLRILERLVRSESAESVADSLGGQLNP